MSIETRSIGENPGRILDRSRLKLDLDPINLRRISIGGFPINPSSTISTPISAPARSSFTIGHSHCKRDLAMAAPGKTMWSRNREKSPIDSLQRIWEEKKRKDTGNKHGKRKSVTFLLVNKPAGSNHRFYQKSTIPSTPWHVGNAQKTIKPVEVINDGQMERDGACDDHTTRITQV